MTRSIRGLLGIVFLIASLGAIAQDTTPANTPATETSAPDESNQENTPDKKEEEKSDPLPKNKQDLPPTNSSGNNQKQEEPWYASWLMPIVIYAFILIITALYLLISMIRNFDEAPVGIAHRFNGLDQNYAGWFLPPNAVRFLLVLLFFSTAAGLLISSTRDSSKESKNETRIEQGSSSSNNSGSGSKPTNINGKRQ